jgi:radical SAM superfamily enzyme YgiQ (UPF0313 family)
MLAAVTPEGAQVRFCFESVQDIPFEESWDLVGVTGMGSGLVGAWRIADRFRDRGVKVVIGGIGTTLLGAEAGLKHADAVVLGEAENLWPRIVEDARAGTLAPVYEAEHPPDINTLPLPRYDLLPARYLGPWRPVQATRGCPFSCDYCSVAAYTQQRYRKRPVAQVIRDVRASGSRHIAFIDDNIGVDWDWCGELWTALARERVIWMSQCSLHIADRPDMLELAHRSGGRLLSIGIESTSPDSLGLHGKDWNRPAGYREAIAAIRGHGLDVSTEMMIGLEADDETVFQNTFNFLMDNEISVPRIHIITPVPGTPLYRRMEAAGRMRIRDLSRYTGGQAVFTPANLDPHLLEREYWRLYERLFTPRAIWHRVRRNHASLSVFMRAFILGVNLHYRGHVRRRITPGIV